jgi:hypothetical protein
MPNYVLGLEPVFCFNNFSINWIFINLCIYRSLSNSYISSFFEIDNLKKDITLQLILIPGF